MSKHHLYDESPEIKHDESGGTKVVKPTKKEKSDGQGDQRTKDEGFPIHARHAHERHTMNAKHEHEHQLHEHAHGGVHGKEEMHTRHEHERKEMHTRHEKEAGATSGRLDGAGGASSEPIEKVLERKEK